MKKHRNVQTLIATSCCSAYFLLLTLRLLINDFYGCKAHNQCWCVRTKQNRNLYFERKCSAL